MLTANEIIADLRKEVARLRRVASSVGDEASQKSRRDTADRFECLALIYEHGGLLTTKGSTDAHATR